MQYNYAQIGRLVISKKPEIVTELMAAYIAPKETDLSNIAEYHTNFLKSFPITGSLKENVEHRRLFIAAIFHLYQPEVFSTRNIYVRPGLGKAVSAQVGIQNFHLSKILREVVIMEKAYEDFKERVQQILEVI